MKISKRRLLHIILVLVMVFITTGITVYASELDDEMIKNVNGVYVYYARVKYNMKTDEMTILEYADDYRKAERSIDFEIDKNDKLLRTDYVFSLFQGVGGEWEYQGNFIWKNRYAYCRLTPEGYFELYAPVEGDEESAYIDIYEKFEE